MALHFAPVIQSNVLFKYLDDAKDIKLPVVSVNCKFESCELHWITMGISPSPKLHYTRSAHLAAGPNSHAT